MTDVFTTTKRSAVMSRIRSKGNRDTELRLITIFRINGITGWRRGTVIRGQKTAAVERKSEIRSLGVGVCFSNFEVKKFHPFCVRPDFVFQREHIVVFVDGCFWHGCPLHATWPKQNATFWRAKILGNRKRDRLVSRTLRKAGWRVLRIWEHELTRNNESRLMRRLMRVLKQN
jgi:DNA mismatch endonuclease (patch repair protein)